MQIIDSYIESNRSSALNIYEGGSFAYVGQSFSVSTEAKVSKATAYLKKNNNPTGNVTAYLYAHSGTYGSSSVPTGSPIATSRPYDVSTLPSDYELIDFDFPTRPTLSASTNYCLVLSVGGGSTSATNRPLWGSDNSSPTHGGNYFYSSDGTTWNSGTAHDMIFYIYDYTTPTYDLIWGGGL